MSVEDYAGIHGRRPGDDGHGGRDPHFVPNGWEDLDVGICPHCGRTVRWDEATDMWRSDASLTVLVLTQDEYDAVVKGLKPFSPIYADEQADTRRGIETMYDLNRPFIDPDWEVEECSECGHLHWVEEAGRYIQCPLDGECSCPYAAGG